MNLRKQQRKPRKNCRQDFRLMSMQSKSYLQKQNRMNKEDLEMRETDVEKKERMAEYQKRILSVIQEIEKKGENKHE